MCKKLANELYIKRVYIRKQSFQNDPSPWTVMIYDYFHVHVKMKNKNHKSLGHTEFNSQVLS